MNLKTVSTILFVLSLITVIFSSWQQIAYFTTVDEAQIEYWHISVFASILFYIFTAYFFWNFRQRVK